MGAAPGKGFAFLIQVRASSMDSLGYHMLFFTSTASAFKEITERPVILDLLPKLSQIGEKVFI